MVKRQLSTMALCLAATTGISCGLGHQAPPAPVTLTSASMTDLSTAEPSPVAAPSASAAPSSTAPAPSTPPQPSASPDKPATPPKGDFKWPCVVASDHDTPIVLAVKDDGPNFAVGTGSSLHGPFTPVETGSGGDTYRSVVDAANLKDPDLADAFKFAGVKLADVATMTVYGIAIRGGWGLGEAVFKAKNGAYLGRAGWRMRVGNAVSCDTGGAR